MDEEQRVIEFVAANRFPFPGQTDWPEGYRTVSNGNARNAAIDTPDGGRHWPDIVILDADGVPCRLGEVDAAVDAAAIARWQLCSQASDTINETGVRNLFVYVPRARRRRRWRRSTTMRSRLPACANTRSGTIRCG